MLRANGTFFIVLPLDLTSLGRNFLKANSIESSVGKQITIPFIWESNYRKKVAKNRVEFYRNFFLFLLMIRTVSWKCERFWWVGYTCRMAAIKKVLFLLLLNKNILFFLQLKTSFWKKGVQICKNWRQFQWIKMKIFTGENIYEIIQMLIIEIKTQIVLDTSDQEATI